MVAISKGIQVKSHKEEDSKVLFVRISPKNKEFALEQARKKDKTLTLYIDSILYELRVRGRVEKSSRKKKDV